jgi:hypothetical protein
MRDTPSHAAAQAIAATASHAREPPRRYYLPRLRCRHVAASYARRSRDIARQEPPPRRHATACRRHGAFTRAADTFAAAAEARVCGRGETSLFMSPAAPYVSAQHAANVSPSARLPPRVIHQ